MNKKEFLDSKQGSEWFRSKTEKLTRRARHILKKWILDPPSNVKRWLKWDKEIKQEIDK